MTTEAKAAKKTGTCAAKIADADFEQFLKKAITSQGLKDVAVCHARGKRCIVVVTIKDTTIGAFVDARAVPRPFDPEQKWSVVFAESVAQLRDTYDTSTRVPVVYSEKGNDQLMTIAIGTPPSL
jgi:hypothetical protein